MRDPHVQELLKTTNPKAVAREKSKLAQLEVDSNTPMYAGCRPTDSRLKVALSVLEMKSKYKWSDVSVTASLKFWHDLLPDENKCPSSLDEAKKIVCPLDLPHVKYHACINDCYIYPKDDEVMTTCPVCGAA